MAAEPGERPPPAPAGRAATSGSSQAPDLDALARAAEAAADAARAETLPRFRRVATEIKADGSPVTEADRAGERAIRSVLAGSFPGIPIVGEELGGEPPASGPAWIVDPIDGTIAFSRGIPLWSTLIALTLDGESVVGLVDLPAIGERGERYVARRGGGCWRNGEPVRASTAPADRSRVLVAVGDPLCFDRVGERAAYERIVREFELVRGYTDAFGHAQVLHGGVDAMVDVDLKVWDVAATRVLVPEAGGACVELRHEPEPRRVRHGLVIGSPALVERLAGWLERR